MQCVEACATLTALLCGFYLTFLSFVGGVSVLNLQERPAVAFRNPFDTLVLHVTQAALNEVAYEHRMPRAEPLVWPFGHFDSVVYNLGQTLLASLAQTNYVSKIFVDHVLHAFEQSFCLLIWRGKSIGSALSGWTLPPSRCDEQRIFGGPSRRQY
jgi:hypothetical protein